MQRKLFFSQKIMSSPFFNNQCFHSINFFTYDGFSVTVFDFALLFFLFQVYFMLSQSTFVICLHLFSNLNGAGSYIICQHMVFNKLINFLFLIDSSNIFSTMNDFPKLKLCSIADSPWLNTSMI